MGADFTLLNKKTKSNERMYANAGTFYGLHARLGSQYIRLRFYLKQLVLVTDILLELL